MTAPRYLNMVLFLRMLTETAAVILVTVVVLDLFGRAVAPVGPAARRSLVGDVDRCVMFVVSFVVIGVAPAHPGPAALRARSRSATAGVVLAVSPRCSGPLPQLLILVGNAITPGKGFSEGPFASEAELRELVDLAEASSVIESGERQMIHSVFELGDTSVREVMVPRTDVVFIERSKTLRQAMSLACAAATRGSRWSATSLDDIVGFAYLKDIAKRVFDRHEAEIDRAGRAR